MNKVFFVLMVGVVAGCQPVRRDAGESGTCFEVTYVAGICRQAVLKIETPAYRALGETWESNKHVFFTRLPCGRDEATLRQGTFFVSLVETEDLGSCAVCRALFDYSGTKRYSIKFEGGCPN